MNWTADDLKSYMTRRLASEQRAREKISRSAKENRPPIRARSPQALAVSGETKVQAGRVSRSGYSIPVVKAFFREYGVPEPEFEYRFDPERKWRFDLAFLEFGRLTAIEVQGGLFSRGAHVRPARMIQEFEKWNRATVLRWKLLFVTPQQLLTKQTVDMVRECLGLCPVPDKHIGMAARV